MTKVLAVDGDTLAYRTAAVCNDMWEGSCRAILDSTLKTISTETGIHHMRIYLSGEGNFRYKVATTKPYKGNREGMVHPTFLQYCKDYLVEQYGAIRVHGYEADDAIATDMVENGAVHCGVDKDIFQIAGDHYNYTKEEMSDRWVTITEEDAIIRLYRQVLCGDNSDNIPGLPRVGVKTAEAVIVNAETALSDALAYYEEVCRIKLPQVNPTVYFIEQSDLITMRTNVPLYCIDFDVSTYIEPETEGFSVQEGDFNG